MSIGKKGAFDICQTWTSRSISAVRKRRAMPGSIALSTPNRVVSFDCCKTLFSCFIKNAGDRNTNHGTPASET
ncbi:MAG: hypothetical protein KDA91_21730, partial [Planctomycetaceae bacterium]|nr:hypothetical protein [Planctomycetaceae bacterium]